MSFIYGWLPDSLKRLKNAKKDKRQPLIYIRHFTLNIQNMSGNMSIIKDINIIQSDTVDGDELDLIRKKTERLASALYLITDFFPNKEPLKWLLRREVLRIVPETLSLKLIFLPKEKREDILNKLEIDTLKVLSLLETAYMGGLISEMNYNILFGEFLNLIRMGKSYSKSKAYSISLNQNLNEKFFREEFYRTDYKRQKKNQVKVSDSDVFYNKDKKEFIKDINYKNKQIYSSNLKDTGKKEENKKAKERNERQIKIIELIKDKKEVSIKDISSEIKDCSDKTIQRELIAMVHSGVLKKEGERRWSRYSLNL